MKDEGLPYHEQYALNYFEHASIDPETSKYAYEIQPGDILLMQEFQGPCKIVRVWEMDYNFIGCQNKSGKKFKFHADARVVIVNEGTYLESEIC